MLKSYVFAWTHFLCSRSHDVLFEEGESFVKRSKLKNTWTGQGSNRAKQMYTVPVDAFRVAGADAALLLLAILGASGVFCNVSPLILVPYCFGGPY